MRGFQTEVNHLWFHPRRPTSSTPPLLCLHFQITKQRRETYFCVFAFRMKFWKLSSSSCVATARCIAPTREMLGPSKTWELDLTESQPRKHDLGHLEIRAVQLSTQRADPSQGESPPRLCGRQAEHLAPPTPRNPAGTHTFHQTGQIN